MFLSIESSCDESALALLDPVKGILWENIYSQTPTHNIHGGVVPELAVREHLRKFPELLATLPAGFCKIGKIAVTVGPGLVGSLAMGMALGKALALQHNIPLVGVNHLRAHAFSPFIAVHKSSPERFVVRFREALPHLGLLVSGGNTLLYEITCPPPSPLPLSGEDDTGLRPAILCPRGIDLRLIARTKDDAAGEALDKAAKMLGLPYPGGPMIETLAREGDSKKFEFPIPFKESPDLAFSFSGLKTALRYKLQKMGENDVEREKANLAASFQKAVVDALILIVRRILKRGTYKSIGLCGGVSQNCLLRASMAEVAAGLGVEMLLAEPKHCGDNAAMIAFAAWADEGGLREVKGFEPALTIEG